MMKQRRPRCSSVPLLVRYWEKPPEFEKVYPVRATLRAFIGEAGRFVQVMCGCGWPSTNFDLPAQLSSWEEHKRKRRKAK